MSISPNVFRTGKKYRLINYGETYEFMIERFIGNDNYLLKDLHSLELYHYRDLIQYGIGKDYLLEELGGFTG